MPDKAWKAWERTVASLLGGKRRGADYGDSRGGKTDIIHPRWAVECKLLGRPAYMDIRNACLQAERNAEPGQTPIAMVKRKGDRWEDALVVMRLEPWCRQHVGEEDAADGQEET